MTLNRFTVLALVCLVAGGLALPTSLAGQAASRRDLTNADGSIDLYFGPKAPEGYEKNWVKTVPGKGWFVMMRFYGPEQPYFDKTWQMNDFEKIG